MSILNVDKLLAPVAKDNPCGEDLSDLTEYYILEEYAKGKEDSQFAKAEPPDWRQVETLSQDLLLQGKEMWVIFHLLCAMTANHGIKGFCEGIQFLFEVLSAFWENIFPENDFDDPNPYEQRMGVLKSLSDISSPLLLNIRNMPICKSKQLGEFSFRDILIARGEIKATNEEAVPDQNIIDAAIRDTDPKFMAEQISLMKTAVEYVNKIESFLNDAAGRQNNTANILKISEVIESISAYIEPYCAPEDYEDSGPEEQDRIDADEAPQNDIERETVTTASGGINNRDDIYALLDEIVQWYGKNEPASPVGMLLERAKSMVGKDFFHIISNILGPDIPQIQLLFGPSGEYPALGVTPAAGKSPFPIHSRNDVVKYLDITATWYSKFEPSSPVPLFIHRAKQLVGKRFQEIISEIANQAQGQVAELLNNKT